MLGMQVPAQVPCNESWLFLSCRHLPYARHDSQIVLCRIPDLMSLRFWQVEYPEVEDGVAPRHRFMSSFEQRKETTDRKYQYLLFNAAPYEVSILRMLV